MTFPYDVADLKRRLEKEDWHKVDAWTEARRVFLGTVFNVYPSGKYYTPFATGSATEEDAAKDEAFSEAAQAALEPIEAFIEHGDDPCDVFVVQQREIERDEQQVQKE